MKLSEPKSMGVIGSSPLVILFRAAEGRFSSMAVKLVPLMKKEVQVWSLTENMAAQRRG